MNLWGSSFFPTSLHVLMVTDCLSLLSSLLFISPPSFFLLILYIFPTPPFLFLSPLFFRRLFPPPLSDHLIRPLYVFSYLPLPGFELQFFSPNFTTLSTRPISLSLNICPLKCTNDNCNRIICIYMPVHLYYEFKTIKAFLLLNQFFLYFEWSLFWELVQCMQYDINTIWVFQTIK